VRGREHKVEDDEPGGALSKAGEGLFLGAGLDDEVSLASEELAVDVAEGVVVIDEEHRLGASRERAGSIGLGSGVRAARLHGARVSEVPPRSPLSKLSHFDGIIFEF
jgi:hypothetical protein